jgi:5-methylcytosine-specific restriction protein A
MGWKPDKPCPSPGCDKKIPPDEKYCAEHLRAYLEEIESRRPSSFARGYTRKWLDESRAFREKHPWCAKCGLPSTETDHIKPHKGNIELFWNKRNWQALCHECHSRKTATEGRWKPGEKEAKEDVEKTEDKPFRING